MMKYLLDTNICIYVINDHPAGVLQRFRQHDIGEIAVSSVTVGELAYGIEKTRSKKNERALRQFLIALEVIEFGHEDGLMAGKVRAALDLKGSPIGPYDVLIAAHAKARGLTLVTNNEREFARVPGLRVENWARDS
ncbi:MAG: type II toxin-antitoxin system VapC family toxin [Archangium sp.]|nr:type II toxin-antitoxin system VapC family toxin [Archangium sp.]